MKIGILGTGTWAMGLASILLDNQKSVIMWGRSKEQVESLKKTGKNFKYSLPRSLEGDITFTTELKDLIAVDYLVNAIPTQKIRGVFQQLKGLSKDSVIVNASKGIEVDTLAFVSRIVADFYPENKYVVLSGPSHAEEVSKKIPTTLVASSKDRDKAVAVRDLFFTNYCRVYTNEDLIGAELAGALKNIIALAAGISDGLGFGDNTKAALMTRGMAEIKRLGLKMGAQTETFDGLTGIGDLIVTCTSRHSRNRRCGILIGEGLSLEEASKRIGMAVEGAATAKAAYELAKKLDCEMPIAESLYKVLYENHDPVEAVQALMVRERKAEN